jgi:hypothetical protein
MPREGRKKHVLGETLEAIGMAKNVELFSQPG